MKRAILCFALACTWSWLPQQGAVAQEDAGGAVVGQGSARIERVPELLRVQVALSGQGKSIKEALADLRNRQKEARAKLQQLGAQETSVKFSEPAVSTASNDGDQRMRRMFRESVRSKLGSRGVEKLKLPEPRVVSATLTAEWPLKFEGAEDLLVVAHELQEKIQAADVAGAGKSKAASPEEQELAEEYEGFMEERMGRDDEPKPGTPSFAYVSKITSDEHAKLLAQAFAQAKKKAAQLAAATGSQLGDLRQIRETVTGFEPEELGSPYGYQRYAQMMQRMGAGGSDDQREAIGRQPGKVEYRVIVTSSFGLK